MEDIARLIKTYNMSVIAGSVALLALLGIVFGVLPLAEQVFVRIGGVESDSREITALQEKSSLLSGEDASSLQTTLSVLTAALPADISLPTILGTLDTVSAQSGVTLESFTLTKAGSIATSSAKKLTSGDIAVGSNVVPVTLQVKGTFDEVHQFLTTIASVRRLFKVTAFNITFAGATVNASVSLNAFYLPYPVTLGALSAPVTDLTSAETKLASDMNSLPLAFGTVGPVNSTQAAVVKTDPFAP